MIAWSWSRIESFETCPKQFYHSNIKKDFKPDFEAPHFAKGNRIHAKIENALKIGLADPERKAMVDPEIKSMAGIIFRLCGMNWDVAGVEQEYAYDSNWGKAAWRDWRNCKIRVKMDFIGIKDNTAVIFDWKTGKNRGAKDQLDLSALVAMQDHNVQTVKSSYYFVDEPKENQIEKREFTAKDKDHLRQKFEERAELITIADETNNWPAKKSWACRFCAVSICENYQGGGK